MELPKTEIPALKGGEMAPPDFRAGGAPAGVLVVDDNTAMLGSIASVVAGMGLDVVTARSGREALRQLLTRDFALILLDVNMPTMDGFETASLIHARPRSAHVPIIFVTAEARGEEERFRGYNLGAVDFIHSPILPEILRAKVQVFADLFYLNRRLQQQAEELAQHAEEIARKNLQLEEASKMKSEFLANMSHELRTPLNAIIGFAEILKDGLAGKLAKEQADYAGEIFNSGVHLLSLINDILDLSKVEAGKMTLEPEAVEVAPLLQASLGVIKEKALKHRIALSLDLKGAPEQIVADARKVKQIVYNLLSNAVKFTPDGGQVRVSARVVGRDALRLVPPEGMALRQLPLPDSRWGEFLEIQVCDTGIGIPAADLDRLFQAFLQLDASLARNYEGTGLGLALVKRMTALHEGTVAVASEKGKGACFAVWLPTRAELGASPAAPPPEPPPGAEKAETAEGEAAPSSRVLVIEDDSHAAAILRAQLEGAGFGVVWAPDAEKGLEMAAAERPDLITLDLLLPGIGGWEALQRMKADPALKDIPVVIVSIVADKGSGFALGAARVLQKPVLRAELLGALAELGLKGKKRGPFTVLAVDDDPKALELVKAHLSGEKGCTVLTASGGQEALDKVRQGLPDLMILDLMMPGVSGFDVVDELKSDPAAASLPVLILTAKTVTEEDRERLSGHVLRIMEKSSFDYGGFLAEVRRALAGRK